MELNKDQFRLTVKPGEEDVAPHRVLAHHGDEPVGFIAWNPGHGEIEDIETHPDYRRQGIATAMYRTAQDWSRQNGQIGLVHSSTRTHAGNEWAVAVGDQPYEPELPPGLEKFNKKRFLDHFEDGYNGRHEGY